MCKEFKRLYLKKVYGRPVSALKDSQEHSHGKDRKKKIRKIPSYSLGQHPKVTL